MGKRSTLAAPKQTENGTDEADQGPDELLVRSARHLQQLQRSVEATLKLGLATPALARESASVARAINDLDKSIRERGRRSKEEYERMTDREKFDLCVDWLVKRPHSLRLEAHATLGESLKANRR